MSEDDDDYLSDKFLIDTSSAASTTKTYTQIRRDAERKAQLKNQENRLKGRRQREIEAREEGLSKSLFERAKEEEDAGISSGNNKALSMMMKMGFKPGQSLGNVEESAVKSSEATSLDTAAEGQEPPERKLSHKVEPIPLNEWAGKKGIGLGKRARSPTSAERIAKMAKMAETNHRDYRDRARQEYEERRAESQLVLVQRTCATLDEQAGKSFNVLWLNPDIPNSFPEGFTEALIIRGNLKLLHEKRKEPIQERLRQQMQLDALEPLDSPERSPVITKALGTFSTEVVEEAAQFLRLQAQDRLQLVLSYLRDNYMYCFWCGVQYENEEMMDNQCPGPNEESHD